MMRKYINYLLFLGIIIATAGIVAGKVSEKWSPLAIGLSVGGMVILVVWLGLFLKSNKEFWGLRSTEAGTNAIISTVAVIVILGLVNFLAFRYALRIDLTETKLFTLSPQSQEIVANLPQELKVYIFERQPHPADRKLLENYRRQSPKFSFEFVDPQVNLKLTQQFKVQSVGEVYLQFGDKQQLVQTLKPNTRLAEVQLTNAIAKIQRDKQPIIYILQGHGEPPLQESEGSLSQAVTALEDKGYVVEPLNLATNPVIPLDADAIVIATPKRELLLGEVKSIEKYIDQGGNLLIMLNANTKSGLEPLLREWGIILDGRLLVDASGTGQILGLGPATTLIVDYGAHPITEDFTNSISVFPLARAIMTRPVEGVEAIALLITNNQTWAELNLDSEGVELNLNEDIPGPLDVGVALVRKEQESTAGEAKTPNQEKETDTKESSNSDNQPKQEQAETPSDNEETDSTLPTPPEIKTPEQKQSETARADSPKPEAKMVVIGNSNFATNGWFQQQLNGDVFLNSVGWLASDEEKILSIRPKEAKNRRLNLTTQQAGIIGWLALLIVPALGFLAAIITWWKRR
jgi:ABC-type uncharacterized transport system involved in gliding motility auxiliary subunit